MTHVDRLKALYTGAVADVLDRMGYRNQILPARINPVTFEMKAAGTAFTCQFVPATDQDQLDDPARVRMMTDIRPGDLFVGAVTDGPEASHWGELMSRGILANGAVGAVIDGGLRDTDEVIKLGFPVFYAYRHAGNADGRWSIGSWNTPVIVGGVTIAPGDYVLADIDGVVIVPKDVIEDVLAEAEAIRSNESRLRDELEAGGRPEVVFSDAKI